ncbi:MAG TPA: PhzF family phenazine biosynthesis protein [Candidatus Limnocylindrales bacterium]|nr:PhzF family phenazine biosynthesis protein [Candidatus Limnocylindrales bacterium]
MTETELTVLSVFVGRDGRGGNALGVFLDGAAIPPERRQAVAAALGFAETVFVDDPDAGLIHIHTPTTELAFAGHPTVGTAWFLRESGHDPATLRPPAGDLPVRHDTTRTWVRARSEWFHGFRLEQLESAAAVAAFPQPPMGEPGRYVWAWIDEAAGEIRSRSFPTDFGIAEDEATGLAALGLCALLDRSLTIRQGVGSEIAAVPAGDGTIELGGRVELIERRPFVIGQ